MSAQSSLKINAIIDAEQVRLQEKLMNANLMQVVQERLGFAFTHAEIPMLATSIVGDLISANEALAHLLGYSALQMQSIGLEKLIHPDDWQKCLTWGNEAVYAKRDTFKEEIRYQNKSGDWVYFLLTSRTMRDDDGDALWFFSQMVDMTQVKQAEQALARYTERLEKANNELALANEFKTKFLATTSHDLRTPLTTIHGFAHLLCEDKYDFTPAKQKEYLKLILGQSARLQRMLDDLLIVSKLQGGKVQAYPERVKVLDSVNSLVLNLGLSGQVKINIDESIVARVDPHHLDRILENYLMNAQKYAPKSDIEIRAFVKYGMINLEIIDQGPGVDAAFAPRLFDAFTQAATTSYEGAKGSGLGLAIVAGLVAQNGGSAYYVAGKKQGSIFGIKLILAA